MGAMQKNFRTVDFLPVYPIDCDTESDSEL
jgi:hypothetical protein